MSVGRPRRWCASLYPRKPQLVGAAFQGGLLTLPPEATRAPGQRMRGRTGDGAGPRYARWPRCPGPESTGTGRIAPDHFWVRRFYKRLPGAGRPVPHAAEPHRLGNAEQPRRSWGYGVSECPGKEASRARDRAFRSFWHRR